MGFLLVVRSWFNYLEIPTNCFETELKLKGEKMLGMVLWWVGGLVIGGLIGYYVPEERLLRWAEKLGF